MTALHDYDLNLGPARSELNAGGLVDHLNAQAEAEAPARRQPGQLVELLVEGEEPYTVRITNRDRIAYEKAAARHKEWPESGRSFAMTFLCWSAARRDGRTALTFDQWQNALEDWDVVQVTGTDPTQ